MTKRLALLTVIAALALFGTAAALADSVGPITFEPPTYALGNINGQNGWVKTGSYDVAVASVSSFPAASGYGFGTQALRVSNATASGSFGDQTFGPLLANAAGESTSFKHFDATFDIGTTSAAVQPGLAMSVSPDDGLGDRMSYLRFEDQADGVHVFFDDVTDAGPLGTTATFNEHDIATLDRTQSHTIRFSMDFVPGPGNDVVRIYIDGALKATGTSWENYYRYDNEQNANHNVVPVTKTLLFREGGSTIVGVPGLAGNGFLVDGVTYASSNSNGGGTSAKNLCKHGGWKTFSDPSYKNQGQCVSAMNHAAKSNNGKANGNDDSQGSNKSQGNDKSNGKGDDGGKS